MDSINNKIIIKNRCTTEEQRAENMKKLEKTIEEIVSKNYSGANVKIKYEA